MLRISLSTPDGRNLETVEFYRGDSNRNKSSPSHHPLPYEGVGLAQVPAAESAARGDSPKAG